MAQIKLYNDKTVYKTYEQIIFNVESTSTTGNLDVVIPLGFKADHIEVSNPREGIAYEKPINDLYGTFISSTNLYANADDTKTEDQVLRYQLHNPNGEKIVLTFKFIPWLNHYGKPRSYDIAVRDNGLETKVTVNVDSTVKWRIFSDDARWYQGKTTIQGNDEWVDLHSFVVLGRQVEGNNAFIEYNELVKKMKVTMFRTECMKARYVIADSKKDAYNIETDHSPVLYKTSHDNASRTFPASTFTITKKDGSFVNPRLLGPIAFSNNNEYSGIQINGVDCTHGKEKMPAFVIELEFENGDIVKMQPITWANFSGNCGWCGPVPGAEKLDQGVQVHYLETIKGSRKTPVLSFSTEGTTQNFTSLRTEGYDGRTILTFSLANSLPQVQKDFSLVLKGDLSKIKEFYHKDKTAIKSVSFGGTEVQQTNGVWTNPGVTEGDLVIKLAGIPSIGSDTGFNYHFFDKSYILYKSENTPDGHVDPYTLVVKDDTSEVEDSSTLNLNVVTHTSITPDVILNFANQHITERSTLAGTKIHIRSFSDTLAQYTAQGVPNFYRPTLLVKKSSFWDLNRESVSFTHPTLWTKNVPVTIQDVVVGKWDFWAITVHGDVTAFKDNREYYELQFDMDTRENIEEVLDPKNYFMWTTEKFDEGAKVSPLNMSQPVLYRELTPADSENFGVLGTAQTNTEFSINLAEGLYNIIYFDEPSDTKRTIASNDNSDLIINACLKNRTQSPITGRIEIPYHPTYGRLQSINGVFNTPVLVGDTWVVRDVTIQPGMENDLCFTMHYNPENFDFERDNIDKPQITFIADNSAVFDSNEVQIKIKKLIRKASVYQNDKGEKRYLITETNHNECNPIFYKKGLE